MHISKALINKNLKNAFFTGMFLMLFLSLFFAACSKVDEETGVINQAKIQVVYASPNGPPVDFYLDNAKKNEDPLSYFTNTGYFEVASGNDLSIGYQLPGTNTTIASQFLNFRNRVSYTLYLTGQVIGTDYSGLKTISSADTTVTPAEGKAKIRIVNAIADGKDIDFYYGEDTIVTKLKNRAVNNFLSVDAKKYTFNIRLTGNAAILTSTDLTLETGKVYTFLARGISSQQNGETGIMLTPINNN